MILDETFSKEPLGPGVRDGDSDWFDAVNWIVIATIRPRSSASRPTTSRSRRAATTSTYCASSGSPSPRRERTPVLDPGLDLDPEFAVDVISAVGNYGEIYDRNVGPGSPLGLERGLNALSTAEPPGLLFAPPYR